MITCCRRWLPLLLGALVLAAACAGADAEPCADAECREQLEGLLDDIDWEVRESTDLDLNADGETVLADTLPPIEEYPLSVSAPAGGDRVVVEIFASTEKSGDDENGWMVEVAKDFNDADMKLADGSTALVEIRRIASGTGYQFIAAGKSVPDAFSPSNRLWIEMASEVVSVEEIRSSMVPNIAGIVMRDETADLLRASSPSLDPSAVIDAVIGGEIVMGYTNPFASSTGLNFMLTVLDDIADGQEDRLTAPDVASVFQQFQDRVPFVALTTLQLRESVQNDQGTLDAFVMEWQTYQTTPELRSGFEFIPFGVPHDNPLHAIGDLPAERLEVLELFATFADQAKYQDKAADDYRFDPPVYDSDVAVPSGQTLIDLQQVWKENKDGGDPVAVVFVVDVSGSMLPSRIGPLRTAMLSSADFISEDTSIGVVEFSDVATLRLPVQEFDAAQEGRFRAAAQQLSPSGGTAMYDGIILGLDMVLAVKDAEPSTRALLVVLTDGATTAGLPFKDVDQTIEGLRIPVVTVGFEADLAELGRLSALVEAASINADTADVEFKMAELFNALG